MKNYRGLILSVVGLLVIGGCQSQQVDRLLGMSDDEIKNSQRAGSVEAMAQDKIVTFCIKGTVGEGFNYPFGVAQGDPVTATVHFNLDKPVSDDSLDFLYYNGVAKLEAQIGPYQPQCSGGDAVGVWTNGMSVIDGRCSDSRYFLTLRANTELFKDRSLKNLKKLEQINWDTANMSFGDRGFQFDVAITSVEQCK